MSVDDEQWLTIAIAHFNDVYHVNNATRIARFATSVSQANTDFAVFSGDAFSPSIESSILKDFDFGEQGLVALSASAPSPGSSPTQPLHVASSSHPRIPTSSRRLALYGWLSTDRVLWPRWNVCIPPSVPGVARH